MYMAKTKVMNNVYIGRQPIYDRKMHVHAYELLFGDSKEKVANYSDTDLGTTQLMANIFLEIGLERIVGQHPAFIKLTRHFILGHHPLPVDPKQVTLEILDDIHIDKELVAAITKLSESGYQIALGDFTFNKEAVPLLELADIIKIDLRKVKASDLPSYVQRVRMYPARFLAEKVETQEEYELCKNIGFDYFQGYFFCQPRIITAQRVPSNRLTILKLLGEISNPVADIHQLSTTISQDVSLSYKLLRYINSVQFALRTEVDSIENAVMMLGLDVVRNLANLLILSNIEDKPSELFVTALVRAQMCELIARQLNLPQTAMYFTTGLFSVIDAMMDQPMESIMALLPLTDVIVGALTHGTGEAGEILHSVIAYERGDWDNAGYAGLDANQLREFYLQAINWSDETTNSFGEYKAA